MDSRRFFLTKAPYKTAETTDIFLRAVKENIAFHRSHCPAYKALLEQEGFSLEQLKSEADLWCIPILPTLYFKQNASFSLPQEKLLIKATSSGTKGSQSVVAFDWKTLMYGIGMMFHFFSWHKVLSLIPCNYIILGYEPSSHTQMGAIKTAYGTTKFAPALHREYALKDTGTDYAVNIDGIRNALLRYAKSPFPVRFVGFPAYLFFLLEQLEKEDIRLKLPRQSKVILGGGWKQFSGQEISRELLLSKIADRLGIDRENVLEFFSAVEHPIPYVKCKEGHFHVPKYSRVIIRDVASLAPVPEGEKGLLSFVTPLVGSMPLVSVVTDDIALMRQGGCGCGLAAPYFELLGRAGVRGIQTCAAVAGERLRGAME